MHHEIDIMLDTFPYTGGTTAKHALWMGVPVVTLAGRRRSERGGTANVARVGLEDWSVTSIDAYIARAVHAANDLPSLATLRSGMRERIANSPMRQLSAMYGFAPPINGAATQARTDGYLWGMMRNGRGLMASFNRIPDAERWDVVNYIRGLQGRYPVATGPVTFPGGAAAFSGHSSVAPTAPAAYVRPSTAGVTPAAAKPAGPSTTGGH